LQTLSVNQQIQLNNDENIFSKANFGDIFKPELGKISLVEK